MDKKQVGHIVGQIYGARDIDIDKYLRKIISFELLLEKGKASNYLDKYTSFTSLFNFEESEQDEIDAFFSDITIGIDIRTQEEMFNKAEIMHGLVCHNAFRDGSIMIFEILMLALYEKQNNNSLRWIFEDGYFVNEENQLGKVYYTMIKNYVATIKVGTYCCYGRSDNYIAIKESAIGKAFFLVACMEYEYEKGGICGQYHCGGDIDQLVELAKKLRPLLCV